MQKTQNTMELKSMAKAVTEALKRQGHSVPHSAVLHALASAGNLRDWHKLLAHQPGESPLQADKAFDLVKSFGATADGVLSWGGWNTPATLDLRRGTLDAGDFHLENSTTDAVFEVHLPKVGKVGFSRVCFVPKEMCGENDGKWFIAEKSWEAFREAMQGRLSKDNAALEGPNVQANFWTDDRAVEVSFDARPYLQQASNEALRKILEVGCSGGYCTDAVAEYMRDKHLNEDICEAFDYLHARNKSARDTVGFEVSVDQEEFYRWLDAHRTAVLAAYLCDEEGITLSEAQEEEIRGRWDWHDDLGNASEASLSTQEEAAIDAYRRLALIEKNLPYWSLSKTSENPPTPSS